MTNKEFKKKYPKKVKKAKWWPGKNPGIRQSQEYYDWRMAVLKRDKYTCQQCNDVGKRLHIHHIVSFYCNESLRFSVDNGVTLCIDCHKAVHGGAEWFKYA